MEIIRMGGYLPWARIVFELISQVPSKQLPKVGVTDWKERERRRRTKVMKVNGGKEREREREQQAECPPTQQGNQMQLKNQRKKFILWLALNTSGPGSSSGAPLFLPGPPLCRSFLPVPTSQPFPSIFHPVAIATNLIKSYNSNCPQAGHSCCVLKKFHCGETEMATSVKARRA